MSTNAGDTYLYQKSLQTQRDRTPFSKREVIFAQDVNSGGSYGNQIQWDLSQFANVTSGMLDFSNATMQIPVVITATAPDNANANTGPGNLDNLLAFKNGSWNIINSLSVNIDGQEMIQPNSLYNSFVSWKLLTSMSQDDVNNFGSSHLFVGSDNTESWIYNNVEATGIDGTNPSRILNGNGLSNNVVFPKPARFTNQAANTRNNGYWEMGNDKVLKRLSMINDRPDDVYVQAGAAAPANVQQNLGSIRDENCFQQELKNYTKPMHATGTTGDTFIQQWFVLCNIKLAFLSDLFERMPLVRGLYAKINLTLNTGSFIIRCPSHAAGVAGALHCTPNDLFFQNFNPIQILERGTDPTSNLPVALNGQNFLISVGVANAPSTSVSGYTSHSSKNPRQGHPMTSCRITIPVCHVKPDDLIPYLESTKEQRVEYLDVYQSVISNIGSKKNFNSLLSNGSKDVVGLLIIPTISALSNGIVTGGPANTTANGFSTNLSPFVSEVVCPLSITQLQVLYGSENILPSTLNYSYESFMYHFQDFNRLNGNNSLGLNSGLISQKQWEDYYRYYFVALNRKLEEDNMPKSITVSGYNNSNVTADYIVFVITKKSFVINTSTGRVTK